jgi:hypothetical protein
MLKKVAVLALVIVPMAKSAAADHFYVDVETLHGWCRPYEVGSGKNIGSLCEGYLNAIADILVDGTPIHGTRACIPRYVQLPDLRDIVVEALKNAPRTTSKDAHSWAARAISAAYPCKASED